MSEVYDAGDIEAGELALLGSSVYNADSIVSDDRMMDFNSFETVISDYVEEKHSMKVQTAPCSSGRDRGGRI